MKVLFVDHACHLKTKSADFFLEILRREHAVTSHYYESCYRCGVSISQIADADLVVIWEFLPGRRRLFFFGTPCVFVPMYDNEWQSYWQWKRIAWSGMGVISFCDKVSAHARRCGVTNLLDVRYFPDPSEFPRRAGDPKKVFLWERGDVSRRVVETLFPPSDGYSFVVKGAHDFLPRDQYLEQMASCGIVIAPRRKEGIGMAFLEAMAMGKCVVAQNDATMNEYIRDGENGVLFDVDNPRRIAEENVTAVFNRLASGAQETGSAAALHRRWLADAEKINAFLSAQPICRPNRMNRLKLALSYLLYLAEGILKTVLCVGI